MKTYLLFSFLLLISINSIAQDTVWICHFWEPVPGKDCDQLFNIDFENNYIPIAIDSTTTNQWQIGSSSKFELASSGWGKSIVTETINPYPVNYFASFRITIVGILDDHLIYIGFKHKFDTDKGKDGGKIDIYNKFEKKWINIIRPSNMIFNASNLYTETDSIAALNNEPGFSGTSNGVERVHVEFPALQLREEIIDTIDIRFVFAGDSIDNSKAGWIIDDIYIGSIYEGISESPDAVFNIYPNPFYDNIRIQSMNDLHLHDSYIEIIDIKGNLIFSKAEYDGSELNLSELKYGLYLVKIFSGRNCYVQKILKIN